MLVIRCQSLSSFRHGGWGGAHCWGDPVPLTATFHITSHRVDPSWDITFYQSLEVTTATHHIPLNHIPSSRLRKADSSANIRLLSFLETSTTILSILRATQAEFLDGLVLPNQRLVPLSGIFIFHSLSSNAAGKSYFLLHAEIVSLICFLLLL